MTITVAARDLRPGDVMPGSFTVHGVHLRGRFIDVVGYGPNEPLRTHPMIYARMIATVERRDRGICLCSSSDFDANATDCTVHGRS